MRIRIAPAAACLVLAASTTTTFAATDFNVANGLLSTAGNWNNGLPTGQEGTVAINAKYDSNIALDGFDVVHTDGTISLGGGLSSMDLGTNTTWVMNGAGASTTGSRGVIVGAGSSFNLITGNADYTTNGSDIRVTGAGASLVVDGGVLAVGDDFFVENGGLFTINGGIVTVADRIYTPFFGDAAAGFEFNGGTTTADTFDLDRASTATFGGTTAGSLELTVELGSGVTLDWLSGSLMELTIAGADQTFYEGLFAANTLQFEGSNAGAFGDNFQVSGSTLSLVPEPSSLALMGLGGLLIARRRRR